MFRDLVSPTRTSAAAELEAITSERDFFKEKYAAHASEMEAMKIQLKESQRMVDKLRNQVLDLSQQMMELKGGGVGEEQDQLDSRVSSLTEMSNSEHDTLDLQQSRRNSSVSSELSPTPANNKESDKEDNNSEKENNVKNEENDSEEEDESEGDSDDDDSHDNDEAEAIRLKASRMLAWASYQTSTRRTPTKMDDNDEGEVATETPSQPINGRPTAAYTLPTKIQSLLDDDEDTDASSLVEKHQVASDSKVRGGKIGKFVNNTLKDIMGTQSESDSSYEDEHDDYESSSDSECSNLSENLARMQLDVRFADGQDEH